MELVEPEGELVDNRVFHLGALGKKVIKALKYVSGTGEKSTCIRAPKPVVISNQSVLRVCTYLIAYILPMTLSKYLIIKKLQ